MATYDSIPARTRVISGSGSFVSAPDAFSAADSSVRDVLKLEFRNIFSAENRIQPVFATDIALIDLRALAVEKIDSTKLRRDCEILAEAVDRHPESVRSMISALLEGSAEGVEKAAALAEEAGLTEESFVERGGGLLFLVAVAAAAALAGGCATVNSNKPFKAPTTPKPSNTRDAGPPDDAGGRIPE